MTAPSAPAAASAEPAQQPTAATPQDTVQTQPGLQQGSAASLENHLSFPDKTPLPAGQQNLLDMVNLLSRDMGTVVESSLRGQSAAAPDLNQGLNYSLSRILASESERDLNQFIQALQLLQLGGDTQKPEVQSALQAMGLMLHDGKLYNLANRQQILPAQLSALAQLANHKLLAVGTPVLRMTETEQTMRTSNPVISTAVQKFAGLENILPVLQDNTGKIREARTELADTNGKVRRQAEKVETLLQESELRRQEAQVVTAFWENFQQGGQEWLQGLARSGGLQAVNQALADMGIQVHYEPGSQQLVFKTTAGEPLSLEQFQQRWQQGLSELQSELQADRQQIQHETAVLTGLQADAEQQALQLGQLLTGNQALTQQAAQAYEEAKAVYEQLKQLKADPEAWAALSPEEQAQAEALISRFEHDLQPRAIQGLEAARTEQALAQAEIERTRAQGLDIKDLLGRAQLALDQLDQLLGALGGADANKLEQAVAETLALIPQLNLSPQQVNQDFESWLESLEQLNAQFKHLNRSQEAEGLQEKFSADQYRQIQRRLNYHLQKLKALDLQQTERVDQILKSSLQRIGRELSVLVPQTVEGIRV